MRKRRVSRRSLGVGGYAAARFRHEAKENFGESRSMWRCHGGKAVGLHDCLQREPVRIVSVRAEGRQVFRVLLDTDAGITTEECARYHRRVRDCLTPQFPGIRLEVSSPGVDRDLASEADFFRIREKPVCIRHGAAHTVEEIRGIVRTAGGGNVCIETAPGQVRTIALAEIQTAKQEIRWSHGK